MGGHAKHDCIDSSFVRITLEHYGLNPTDTRTSCAWIALLREFEFVRSEPFFAHLVICRRWYWRHCCRRIEKLTNQVECVVRTLFHQPVAGLGHHRLLNVYGNVAHDYRLQRTER